METWSDEYITLQAAGVIKPIAMCPSEAESLGEQWQDEPASDDHLTDNIGCPNEVAEALVEGGNPPVWSGRGES